MKMTIDDYMELTNMVVKFGQERCREGRTNQSADDSLDTFRAFCDKLISFTNK